VDERQHLPLRPLRENYARGRTDRPPQLGGPFAELEKLRSLRGGQKIRPTPSSASTWRTHCRKASLWIPKSRGTWATARPEFCTSRTARLRSSSGYSRGAGVGTCISHLPKRSCPASGPLSSPVQLTDRRVDVTGLSLLKGAVRLGAWRSEGGRGEGGPDA
jgi:hypothetical protein